MATLKSRAEQVRETEERSAVRNKKSSHSSSHKTGKPCAYTPNQYMAVAPYNLHRKPFLQNLTSLQFSGGVRGSVVCWGNMPQAGRKRVQVPMRSLDFFNWPNPSSRTMSLWSTKPLTEMSTRNILGGRGRPARRADNLTAICEPIVYKMWEPQHLTTLWVCSACYRDSLTFFFTIFGTLN
jgi:hypothetical protein